MNRTHLGQRIKGHQPYVLRHTQSILELSTQVPELKNYQTLEGVLECFTPLQPDF